MQIRLRTTLAGPLLTAGAGEIIAVEHDLALALIKAGYAEPIDVTLEKQLPAPTPVAVAEVAVNGPQRRRRQ